MPKTRRAGRKNQLRRIFVQHHSPVYYPYLEVQYSLEQTPNESSPKEEQFLPYKVIPISVEQDFPNPNNIPLSDPRYEHYQKIHSQIINSPSIL